MGPTQAYSANKAASTGQIAMLVKPYSAGELYFLIHYIFTREKTKDLSNKRTLITSASSSSGTTTTLKVLAFSTTSFY
jgi:uncharacterized membrane-anchored protein